MDSRELLDTTPRPRSRAAGATSLGVLLATCVVLGVADLGPQQIVSALAFAKGAEPSPPALRAGHHVAPP